MSEPDIRVTLASLVEELSEEIADAFKDAIATGSLEASRRLEAADKLLDRVQGRPTIVQEVDLHDDRLLEKRQRDWLRDVLAADDVDPG
jgi:hypothetical protein